MVAKIVNGKNIRGVLIYNESKIAKGEAELLLSAGFPVDSAALSFAAKLERFHKLTEQNRMTKTNTMHIMLNFSPRDLLDNQTMERIASDYMNRIGFGQQPYLVYRHYDAAHPHIHIATVNIAEGGKRLETHNIGRLQSEAARKEIEKDYDLVHAEDQQKETQFMLRPVIAQKVIYGKSETKAAISAVVRDVADSYRFTSLPELNAVLRQFNVYASRGTEGTAMFEKGGLIYGVLDEGGRPVGIPIKASSIFGKPILKNLEKKFPANQSIRKPYGQRLKHQLDKAFARAKNQQEFEDYLRKQGIRVLVRENATGRTYGVTFIDNSTRTVFNGSDLGKPYSAAAFSERLAGLAQKIIPSIATNKSPGTITAPAQHTLPSPVLLKIIDAAFELGPDNIAYDPFKRKKKKRIQPE